MARRPARGRTPPGPGTDFSGIGPSAALPNRRRLIARRRYSPEPLVAARGGAAGTPPRSDAPLGPLFLAGRGSASLAALNPGKRGTVQQPSREREVKSVLFARFIRRVSPRSSAGGSPLGFILLVHCSPRICSKLGQARMAHLSSRGGDHIWSPRARARGNRDCRRALGTARSRGPSARSTRGSEPAIHAPAARTTPPLKAPKTRNRGEPHGPPRPGSNLNCRGYASVSFDFRRRNRYNAKPTVPIRAYVEGSGTPVASADSHPTHNPAGVEEFPWLIRLITSNRMV